MKVTGAESFLLEVPIGREIADSMRSVSTLEIVGILVDTDEGVSGTGYTITVGHGGSVIRQVIDSLYVDDLLGQDPFEVREIWRLLYHGKAHWIGRAGATAMAQSAVDIALWDIISKASGKPLWQVLGGTGSEDDVPIYNTHAGWLNYGIEQIIEEGMRLLDDGYTALKMKVGLEDTGEDRRRVEAFRRAIGDDVTLMVDANQVWDLQRATRAAAMLQEFDLAWLEEPMHPDDVSAHRTLAGRTEIPIALGEHLYGTHAFHEFMDQRAVDVVQVDVCRVGGVTPWLEVAAMAASFDLRVCPHAGDLMQVHQHLVRAIPNRWLLEVIPLWEKGPFRHQVQLGEGRCRAPLEPGASTDITRAAMEDYRVA